MILFWRLLLVGALAYGAADLWLRAELAREREAYLLRAHAYLESWSLAAGLLDPASAELGFLGVFRTLFGDARAYARFATPEPNRTRIVIFDRKGWPATHYDEIVMR